MSRMSVGYQSDFQIIRFWAAFVNRMSESDGLGQQCCCYNSLAYFVVRATFTRLELISVPLNGFFYISFCLQFKIVYYTARLESWHLHVFIKSFVSHFPLETPFFRTKHPCILFPCTMTQTERLVSNWLEISSNITVEKVIYLHWKALKQLKTKHCSK